MVNLNTLWLQARILFLMCDSALMSFMKLTPNIVVSSESLTVSPSNVQVGGVFSVDFPICMHLVFAGLNLILHFLAYESQVSISFCSPVAVVLNKFMSSDYAIAFSLKL